MHLQGILLAAGGSRRFGADKLSQPIADDGETVALRAARVLAAGVDAVVAVLGPHSDPVLRRSLASLGVAWMECGESALGMGHSLACGVRASAGADAWLVALADMPALQPETLRRLSAELRAGAPLLAPVYQGRRGHPVGFARRFGTELLALRGDTGARELLQRHAAELRLLQCDDPGVLLDLDTPQDWARLAPLLARQPRT